MSGNRTTMVSILAGVLAIQAAVLRARSANGGSGSESGAEAAQHGGFNEVIRHPGHEGAQGLEGSWAQTISPVPPPGVPAPPPFSAYLTVSRGGALIGSARTSPFDSPLHGTWAHLGGDEFALTLVQDRFDGMGNFLGTLNVRTRVTLTERDEFVGVSSVEVRDAAGNLTLGRCATNHGERITVEPLTPGCQKIAPPQ